MSEADELLKENGFTKQKWLSDVEVSTEHGFSNFIYPYDLEAITLKMQELRLDRRRR